MKIIFIHFGREHLGIQSISAVLKKAGHEVFLAMDSGLFSRNDNVLCQPLLERVFSRKKHIMGKVRDVKPDLVAFSVYSSTYSWAKNLAQEIKNQFQIPVVFGGIHPTLQPEDVIRHDYVDYIIRGEGEYPMLELVEALSRQEALSSIKSLWYKQEGDVIRNEMREPVANLDDLPFPDKTLFEKHVRYKDDYMIMAGRGCLFQCSYCCESYLHKAYKGRNYRTRSVDAVLRELTEAKKRYGFREVMFFDAIFFSDKTWVREFLERYNQEVGVPFKCVGHVNLFDEDIAHLMKQAGCYCINFGVQTFNEDIRKNYLNRFERNTQIEKVFRICDAVKIRYDIDLMFGLPGESEADYQLAFNIISRSHLLNRVKCFYLAYYPGLEITYKCRQAGILDDTVLEKIQQGELGDWHHLDSLKDKKRHRLNSRYMKIFKIYPLLPGVLKNERGLSLLTGFMDWVPDAFIVFLQVLSGIKTGDYRFQIYINHYIFSIKRLFEKIT